jgi:hypothetical protein
VGVQSPDIGSQAQAFPPDEMWILRGEVIHKPCIDSIAPDAFKSIQKNSEHCRFFRRFRELSNGAGTLDANDPSAEEANQ